MTGLTQDARLNRSMDLSSVLFMSDLTDEVEMYSAALELSGFRTMHVRTPLEALYVSERTEPIAIIVNAGQSRRGLPPDSAQHLGLKARLRVPVIVLTAHATGSDPDIPRHIGCERVLLKPCLPDALVQALEDVLGRSGGADAEDRQGQ